MRDLTVLYFAQLRDQRGVDREALTTAATNPRELYQELAQRHGLSLSERHLAVAINETLVRWHAPLTTGDTVVFLPPVSGG